MVSISTEDHVVHIQCDTSAEFLEILSPVGGAFSKKPDSVEFVFRGSSSVSHGLIPSAFRTNNELRTVGYHYEKAPRPVAWWQCSAELNTLRRFFDLATRHGVRIPEDSQRLREQLEKWARRFAVDMAEFKPFIWPPSTFYSLIALAQHHGVPTRALDWTWNSLIAAYFAAITADESTDDRLCVWACWSGLYEAEKRAWGPARPTPLKLFTVSGADNDNLRAQEGLFMLWSQRVVSGDDKFMPAPYDSLLLDSMHWFKGENLFNRVSLPVSHRRALLAGLAGAGITAGRLFPGLGGIAREFVEEKELRGFSSGTAPGVITALKEALKREVGA